MGHPVRVRENLDNELKSMKSNKIKRRLILGSTNEHKNRKESSLFIIELFLLFYTLVETELMYTRTHRI